MKSRIGKMLMIFGMFTGSSMGADAVEANGRAARPATLRSDAAPATLRPARLRRPPSGWFFEENIGKYVPFSAAGGARPCGRVPGVSWRTRGRGRCWGDQRELPPHGRDGAEVSWDRSHHRGKDPDNAPPPCVLFVFDSPQWAPAHDNEGPSDGP